MVFPRIVLVVTSCLFTSAALADESPSKPADGASATDRFRDTSLRDLALDVGEKIHKHIVLDPRTRDLVDIGSLKRQDITYPQFLAILQLHGFMAYEDTGLVFVIPDFGARQAPTPVVSPDDIRTPDDQWITVLCPVKSLNAAMLIPVLRPLMPQNAQLSALTDRNALIIVDRSANVRRLVDLIRQAERMPVTVPNNAPSKSE